MKDDDNNWNNMAEIYLEQIGTDCLNLSKQHIASAKNKSKKNNIYTLIVISITLLSSLASIIMTIVIVIRSDENNTIIVAVKEGATTTILLVAAFFTAINNVFKYGDKAEEHHEAASKFSVLYHEIKEQCVFPRHLREEATSYMRRKRLEYEEIKDDAPYIPKKYTKIKYIKTNQSVENDEVNDTIINIDEAETITEVNDTIINIDEAEAITEVNDTKVNDTIINIDEVNDSDILRNRFKKYIKKKNKDAENRNYQMDRFIFSEL
jgi:DNA polymerase III delta prime subunit